MVVIKDIKNFLFAQYNVNAHHTAGMFVKTPAANLKTH